MIGMASLWSSLLLGDISRHGSTASYLKWSQNYAHLPCIIKETRTQGIIERHNKSLKRIYLTQKNDRLDDVIQNLFTVKDALYKEHEIQSIRQKSKPKRNKKNMKRARYEQEKWKPPKISDGLGFYQTPPKKRKISEIPHVKLPVELGGRICNDYLGKDLDIDNTCTIDNFLWICFCWYKSNPLSLNYFQISDIDIISSLYEVLVFLLAGSYDEAKFKHLKLTLDGATSSGVSRARYVAFGERGINAHGTDKNLSVYPLIEMFDRKCSVDCSSNNCPGIKERNIWSNILHLPQCYDEDNLLQVAISTWESGGVQYACNAYFSPQPKSHQASGDQIPREMKFVNIPPLMAFDVVEELSCEVNDLNLIPKHIFSMIFLIALVDVQFGKIELEDIMCLRFTIEFQIFFFTMMLLTAYLDRFPTQHFVEIFR